MFYLARLPSRHIFTQILFFSLFFILSLPGLLNPTDETIFHFPNLVNFNESGFYFFLTDSYSSANTPLPYILAGVILKYIGISLVNARLINIIVAILILHFIRLLLENRNQNRDFSYLIQVLPYFLLNTFAFYVANFGLLFYFAAVFYLTKKEEQLKHLDFFILGILFSMAALCQQFYLIVPFAIFFSYGLGNWKRAISNGYSRKQLIKSGISGLLFVIPFIIPIYVFCKWKGLVHPNFRIYQLSFNPRNWFYILNIIGLYSIPFVIPELRKISFRYITGSSLAAFCIVICSEYIFTQPVGYSFSGLTTHALIIVSQWNSILHIVLKWFFCTMGLLAVNKLWKSFGNRNIENFILITILCVTLLHGFMTPLGERHLLLLIVCIIVLLILTSAKPVLRSSIIYFSLIGISYYLYWIFIKYSALH